MQRIWNLIEAAAAYAMPVEIGRVRLCGCLDDLPKSQIDSGANRFLGLGYLMLPELLHASSHDNQSPVIDWESHRLLG
jgi:hypothetical protein